MEDKKSRIRLYIGGQFENRHEIEEFKKILSIVEKNEDILGDFIVIFGCVFVEGEEIDAIIFKENAIIIVEMKDWSGIINGSENGEWEVNGLKEKNAFQQCRRKRYATFALLNKIYLDIKFDVCAWIVCDYEADCSNVDCNEKDSKWFRCISLNEFSRELVEERSSKTIKSIKEIEKIADKLHLKETNLSDWMKISSDKEYEDIKYLFPKREGEYEEYVFEKNYTQEYVIRYPSIGEEDKPVICFIRNRITGKEYLSGAIRLSPAIWKKIEDYILNIEYSWDPMNRKDIDLGEEGFSVRVGHLTSHGREGVQVEIMKNGESLQSPKRVWFNMRGIEKFQDIILERRNE